MEENRSELIAKCLSQIEQELGWGTSEYWSDSDFEKLSTLVLGRTSVRLSITTLKRVWGKVSYSGTPATATMNALVGFLGYDNWRTFVTQQQEMADRSTPLKPAKTPFRKPVWVWSGCMALLILVVALLRLFVFNTGSGKTETASVLSPEDFDLTVTRISPGIPTSVVFTYDAEHSPSDSVFIQQHWDPNRRALVPKNGHTHTSIYYEPGFFNAKLVIDSQVVKERPLLIPTDGWLATIDDFQSTPIYLDDDDFVKAGMIDIHADVMEKYGLSPLSDLTEIKLYHVGQFSPVSANDFAFTAQVKSNSLSGRDPCRHIWIRLVTERMPIIIPLALDGCVSNLMVSNIDSVYSGKDHDFSGFGAPVSDWVEVACIGTKEHIRYYVDKRLAFEAPMLSNDKHVMGMIVGLSGGGSLRGIRLRSGEKSIFEAF